VQRFQKVFPPRVTVYGFYEAGIVGEATSGECDGVGAEAEIVVFPQHSDINELLAKSVINKAKHNRGNCPPHSV